MKTRITNLKSKVWLYPGMAGWHFITVPKKDALKIKQTYTGPKRGWGSIRVKVTVGETSWSTSIFPDKASGSYLLPLKSQVRKKEEIEEGDTISFELEIL